MLYLLKLVYILRTVILRVIIFSEFSMIFLTFFESIFGIHSKRMTPHNYNAYSKVSTEGYDCTITQFAFLGLMFATGFLPRDPDVRPEVLTAHT